MPELYDQFLVPLIFEDYAGDLAHQLSGLGPASVLEVVDHRSRAATADIPAVAYCRGTPRRNEIEARDPARLLEATDAATAAVAERFGHRDLDSLIRGLVVTARAT